MSRNIIASIIIIILATACTSNNDPTFSKLHGPYIGQTPPGDVPKLFAPGIVADVYREHGSTAFTPDGKEVFWTRQVKTITQDGENSRLVVAMHMKQENGFWSEPDLAPFGKDRWTFITCVTKDGKKLYFTGTRPTEEGGESRGGVWVVEKTNDGWGEPSKFTALDKWGMNISKAQETVSGNIYFTSALPKPGLPNPSWGVGFFRSRLVDGEYQKPDTLSSNINSQYLDYAFHVDQEERFIIFASARPSGYSSLDLYISYHSVDDSWSEAINLGEKINTAGVDGSDWPYLSPDGKYLFFMTTLKPKTDIDEKKYTYEELIESQLSITNPNSKIHWVSTSFIEELKPVKNK